MLKKVIAKRPKISELMDNLPEDISSKIINLSKAVSLVSKLKATHKKIVFTNGCFDILHLGHLYLIYEAKSLGDILILGLNSDSSVRTLKGPGRPINDETTRSALLASMSVVDYVIFFHEETPEDMILELKPDVLVKGGDYTPDSVVGASFVKSCGGEVVIIPLLEGFSSSKIIHKMNKK